MQIRDCGIYLILIIDYSIIVATLQLILHTVVFTVFLVRFYALNYHISYYVFVFQKIIKCILSAPAWIFTSNYVTINNVDFSTSFILAL